MAFLTGKRSIVWKMFIVPLMAVWLPGCAMHSDAAAGRFELLAQTYNVPRPSRDAFLGCLREVGADARLSRALIRRVYEKTGQLNDLAGPNWSFLTIWAAERRRDLMAASSAEARCVDLADVVLLRSEIMAPTPASYHPAAAPNQRRPDLAFVVEFIAVEDTPASLDEYRETMRTSIGPAVGRLVLEGQFFMMIGLETREVLSHNEAFRWNQIHVRGFYADIGPTPSNMTAYMEEANPDLGSFAAVFSRLDVIRRKPQDAVAQEHVELQL